MQRLLVAAFGVTVAAVAITVAASPASATSPAASATNYQNATIAKAMGNAPGGTRISASQVVWKGGSTLIVATGPDQRLAGVTPDAGGCPAGDFCAANGPNYVGSAVALCPSAFFHGSVYFCEAIGGLGVVRSYSNVTAYRVWLQQFESHTNGGVELCINPRNLSGNSNPNYNGAARFDPFAWMSNNTAACT